MGRPARRVSVRPQIVARSSGPRSRHCQQQKADQEDRVPFVYWRETDFEAKAGPKIKGISPGARAIVESLQPYRAWPDHPKSTTIWAIHDLCNTDKHRVLNLTDPWVFTGQVVFISSLEARPDLISFTKPLRRMRLHDDAVIAAYEWDPAEMRALGKTKVNVNVQLSLDIALAEGQWAQRRTGQPIEGLGVRHFVKPALKFMDEILAKFEMFFAEPTRHGASPPGASPFKG